MADELKDQRIVVLMTPTESEAVDAWSFAHRIRSKGEAIRRLIQIGISASQKTRSVHLTSLGSLQTMTVGLRGLHELLSGKDAVPTEVLQAEFKIATEKMLEAGLLALSQSIALYAVIRPFTGKHPDFAASMLLRDEIAKQLAELDPFLDRRVVGRMGAILDDLAKMESVPPDERDGDEK